MADPFDPGAVVAHVVLGPPVPERVAAGHELADQIGEPLVERILPRVAAQGRDDVLAFCSQSGKKIRAAGLRNVNLAVLPVRGIVQHGRVERMPERVGGDEIDAPSRTHIGAPSPRPGTAASRSHRLLGGPLVSRRVQGPSRPGEVVQVVGLGVVELERAGEGVEDFDGDAGKFPALHPRVVLDADAGDHGHLFATQARHAAVSAADDVQPDRV